MPYEYKTYGKTFVIDLRHDGLLYERELGIEGSDLETVKTLIREKAKAEEKAPRIPMLTTGSSSLHGDVEYYEGTTTAITDRYGYRWVSFKKGNGSQRKKMREGIYADTPENRSLLEQATVINTEIRRLQTEISGIQKRMVEINRD